MNLNPIDTKRYQKSAKHMGCLAAVLFFSLNSFAESGKDFLSRIKLSNYCVTNVTFLECLDKLSRETQCSYTFIVDPDKYGESGPITRMIERVEMSDTNYKEVMDKICELGQCDWERFDGPIVVEEQPDLTIQVSAIDFAKSRHNRIGVECLITNNSRTNAYRFNAATLNLSPLRVSIMDAKTGNEIGDLEITTLADDADTTEFGMAANLCPFQSIAARLDYGVFCSDAALFDKLASSGKTVCYVEGQAVFNRNLRGGVESFNLCPSAYLVDNGRALLIRSYPSSELERKRTAIGWPKADLVNSKGFNLKIKDRGDLERVKDIAVWRLDLRNTTITDLSPIGDNITLEQLELDNTLVEDLGPLVKVQSLKRLTLNGTKVTDLTPIGSKGNLEQLELDNTPVGDLGPLVRSQSLERLTLNGTKITDISPLAVIWKDGHRSIAFEADNTGICDISPLKTALRFSLISIEHTKVADLSPLHELKEIRTLRIRGIPCDDFSPVPVDGLDELRIDIDKDWKGLERLRTKKRLEINGMKPEEFWKEYDRLKAERDNKAKEGVMGH